MRRFWSILLLVALLFGSSAAGAVTWPSGGDLPFSPAEVSPFVRIATSGGAVADFLVVLEAQADLSAAYALPTKEAKGRYVRDLLWDTAQRTQAPLRAWLDARGVPYRSFYIVNLIHVLAGDHELVEALDVPQSTVSRHLGILRERGLVNSERKGTAVYYTLVDRRIIEALNLLRAILATQLVADAELVQSLHAG